MDFSIAKDVFLDGLNQVVSAVSARTPMPILSNVLIRTENNQLRLTATDLDVCITGTIPANITSDGSVTLPAKTLLNIIRELPSEEIHISVNEKSQASVECGRSRFKLNGLPSDEFPAVPVFDGSTDFTIDQNMLRDGIKKTEYAISTDTTRYVLNGIFMSFKDNKMTFVATDGRRLAMVENGLDIPEGSQTEAILPTKAVNELSRLLGDVGQVTIRFMSNQVAFEINDTLLTSKLIDGNYPNFRQVIPPDHKECIELPRTEFLETIRRVSLLSSAEKDVRLSFINNELEVASLAEDVGEAHEYLSIDYSGTPIDIAFNSDFLMAPLKSMTSDTVNLYLTDKMSPGVLRSGDQFLYVLMPMRVRSIH